MLPSGMLIDLDDTIVTYDAIGEASWRRALATHAEALSGLDLEDVYGVLKAVRKWYWGDRERHRLGRLRLDEARIEVTLMGLQRLGRGDLSLAQGLCRTFNEERDAATDFFPGAEAALGELRRRGARLAMMTNGQASHQRAKIERFGLERYFEVILVEGELGFGKPDPRVYAIALERLGLPPGDVWAIGDNLEWDVGGPQQLGIHGIWHDYRRQGLPSDAVVTPDRIVHGLAELLD